jgi:hypothetical protein
VLVIVSDPSLSSLLASQAHLLRAWADAAVEVMKFITLLRCSGSSLAEALALGLVALVVPAAALGGFDLRYRRIVMRAIGHRDDGTEVKDPYAHPDEITRIDIVGITVDERAGLRTAA